MGKNFAAAVGFYLEAKVVDAATPDVRDVTTGGEFLWILGLGEREKRNFALFYGP